MADPQVPVLDLSLSYFSPASWMSSQSSSWHGHPSVLPAAPSLLLLSPLLPPTLGSHANPVHHLPVLPKCFSPALISAVHHHHLGLHSREMESSLTRSLLPSTPICLLFLSRLPLRGCSALHSPHIPSASQSYSHQLFAAWTIHPSIHLYH